MIVVVLTASSPTWVLERGESSPSSRMKAHFTLVSTSQTFGKLMLALSLGYCTDIGIGKGCVMVSKNS